MKFCQLIEYNLRNIFLEKSQNVVEKLFPDTFLENQNWAYLWINILKFYIFCYCLASWGLSKLIETKLQTTCILPQIKKRGLELVSLPHFLHNFCRKKFLLYSFTWPNFNAWLPLLHEILSNICILILC